jgi:hypothetical protein
MTNQMAALGMRRTAWRNSTYVCSLFRLAFAAIEETGDRADQAEHDSKPDGPEERFSACEHGVSLSAYVRR